MPVFGYLFPAKFHRKTPCFGVFLRRLIPSTIFTKFFYFFLKFGFSEGYPAHQRVISTNSINVVVNFRLNSFGFLNGFPGIDYNIGLRDQIEALKWINSNIERFGGITMIISCLNLLNFL